MISISKVNSNASNNLFGCNLPVGNYVELKICKGEMERSLVKDNYFPNHSEPLIKIKLSPVQFSELITSINQGEGLPCTISQFNGENINQYEKEFDNKKSFIQKTFKKKMNDFAITIADAQKKVKELVAKKNLSVKDQDEINNLLEYITRETTKNVPFFMECFQESMDKIVLEAKTEIEAQIVHKINAFGLNQLQQQQNIPEILQIG